MMGWFAWALGRGSLWCLFVAGYRATGGEGPSSPLTQTRNGELAQGEKWLSAGSGMPLHVHEYVQSGGRWRVSDEADWLETALEAVLTSMGFPHGHSSNSTTFC